MLNLGYDSLPTELGGRAKKVLKDSGIPDDIFHSLGLPEEKGSWAQICFKTVEAQNDSCARVNAAKVIVHGSKPVRMLPSLTRRERKPWRMMQKAFDMMQDIEARAPRAEAPRRLEKTY